ncbi:MAG: hemolysin family protein [Fibrobacter sp.]|nr:hemolysin family protein [Fibrobacter sp.]
MLGIVITVLLCLGASAFCSVTEASFYSVPPATIELLQKQKKFTARYMSHVKDNIDRYIASVLVVNTVANTVGASLATALAVRNLPPAGQVALPIVLTILILLFGEITPKTLGVKQAKIVAPLVAVPFYYITKILSWTGLIWLCLTLTKHWTRESEEKKDVSIEDINSLVSLGLREDVIDRQQSLVIKNILALKSVPVRKVMTPRQVVFSLDANKTLGESLDERGNWPFSRIPLYEKNKDNWIGTILRRDAYNKLADGHRDIKLRQLMRPLQLIPDSLTLDKLLLRFLKQRGHIVGVVDEWGAIAGVVSLEDVLEEILGREIVDEYDESVDLQESARKRSKALASMREQRRAVTRTTAALARESVVTRENVVVPCPQNSTSNENSADTQQQ